MNTSPWSISRSSCRDGWIEGTADLAAILDGLGDGGGIGKWVLVGF